MITKKDLLEQIDEAIRTEESALPIYLDNYTAAMGWVELDVEKRKQIVDTLKRLAADTKGHKTTLLRIRENILADSRSAY